MHTLYPDSEWLHLYTDGSLCDTETSAGAGIHCKLFDLYLSAGTNSTNFDGEILAIHMALSQLLCRIKLFSKVVILSDSLATIQAIALQSAPFSTKVAEIQKYIKVLTALNKVIKLQWIPAHCGLLGNEHADFLAKKGTKIPQKPHNSLSYHTTKLILNKIFKKQINEKFKLESSNKPWLSLLEKSAVPEAPRYEAVAIFRLLSGSSIQNLNLSITNLRVVQ